MPLNLDAPYSLYSLPVVYATAFYPHFIKFRLIDKTVGFYNQLPRENDAARLEKKGVPKHIIERCTKLAGAHSNGNETFPLWVAAVVRQEKKAMQGMTAPAQLPPTDPRSQLAANYAGVEERTLNIASAAFVSIRLLYNYLYITAKSENVAGLRSVSFFTGLGIPMYLLIKAANKLHAGSRA